MTVWRKEKRQGQCYIACYQQDSIGSTKLKTNTIKDGARWHVG